MPQLSSGIRSLLSVMLPALSIGSQDSNALFFIRAHAKNSTERSRIENEGIKIDAIFSESVVLVGSSKDLRTLFKLGIPIEVIYAT